MSSLMEWSIKAKATVYPFEGEDLLNGGSTYGAPFVINASWIGKSEQRRDRNGAEFVTKDIFWFTDQRPKYKDRIAKHDTSALTWDEAGAEEIRSFTDFDMAMFGESDAPDFEVAT